MFGNMKDLMGLMGQAGQLREKFEAMQDELADKQVEGNAGAGAVRVTVNGKLEVLKVDLDQTMLDALLAPLPEDQAESTSSEAESSSRRNDDKEMIEQLIAAATNDAITKARDLVQQEMSRTAGDIPGLESILKQMPK